MRRVSVLVVLATLLTSMLGVSVTQARQGATDRFDAGRYIVTFADEPVASYDGYEAGFAATRPHPGAKLDPSSPAVQRWQQHLAAKHDKALAEVGAAKLYDYTIANNGVAVELTAAQAAQLAAKPGVVALEKDALAQPATTSTAV